jgi:hypothetical protein
VLKASPRTSKALEFIEFAYQPFRRLRWARFGMVPKLKTVEKDKFFMDDPVWRAFISQLNQARWIPLMRWEPIDRAIRDTLEQALAGRAEPPDSQLVVEANQNSSCAVTIGRVFGAIRIGGVVLRLCWGLVLPSLFSTCATTGEEGRTMVVTRSNPVR